MLDVKLVVVQGKPIGKEIPLRIPRLLVGRGAECQLRPTSELVSRQHCVFILGEDSLRLRDLGSTNGTFVNGHRITGEVVLRHGDTVQIGPLGFRVVIRQKAKQVGTAPTGAAQIGAEEHDEDAVAEWLTSAEPPSSVADMPTTFLGQKGASSPEETIAERAELQETQLGVPIVPTPGQGTETGGEQAGQQDAKAGQQQEGEEEKVVVVEGGLKIKLKGKKQKIEKTREDTSRAADEILRRMLERRPR